MAIKSLCPCSAELQAASPQHVHSAGEKVSPHMLLYRMSPILSYGLVLRDRGTSLIIVHTKVSLTALREQCLNTKKWGSNNRNCCYQARVNGRENREQTTPPTCLLYHTVQLLVLPSGPPWTHSHSLEGPLTF